MFRYTSRINKSSQHGQAAGVCCQRYQLRPLVNGNRPPANTRTAQRLKLLCFGSTTEDYRMQVEQRLRLILSDSSVYRSHLCLESNALKIPEQRNCPPPHTPIQLFDLQHLSSLSVDSQQVMTPSCIVQEAEVDLPYVHLRLIPRGTLLTGCMIVNNVSRGINKEIVRMAGQGEATIVARCWSSAWRSCSPSIDDCWMLQRYPREDGSIDGLE